TILILDFGSQYTQLIARRVRELNVYCEIHPYNKVPKITSEVAGVILSGSPFSVHNTEAPAPDLTDIRGRIPLLGVCYGAQYLAKLDGGKVMPSEIREYGRANLGFINQQNDLLKGMSQHTQVWMSHGDTILDIPENYEIISSTETVKVAGYKIAGEPTYGIQFHPEVYHTTEGSTLLKNFLVDICRCHQNWTPDSFIDTTIHHLRDKLGHDKVVLGLSGGVDSSVAAVLLHKAVGDQLHCIFVDNGLLRKNEFEDVLHSYRDMGLNVTGVDAKDRFLGALKGITDPEKKRKAIGNAFIEVFDQEAHRIEEVQWLAQGTIYPDVIESVSVKGPSATIKSHHNVGGLPDFMKLKV
ncbi:MAG: glutamine-hydrolyzing GMP synthase, partial [Bacteroidetes bacterium CG_4_10_14_3_um_filter_42_6]